jgi:hypothetical protein
MRLPLHLLEGSNQHGVTQSSSCSRLGAIIALSGVQAGAFVVRGLGWRSKRRVSAFPSLEPRVKVEAKEKVMGIVLDLKHQKQLLRPRVTMLSFGPG